MVTEITDSQHCWTVKLISEQIPKRTFNNGIERSTQSLASLTRMEHCVGTKILSKKPVYPLETDLNNEIGDTYLRQISDN